MKKIFIVCAALGVIPVMSMEKKPYKRSRTAQTVIESELLTPENKNVDKIPHIQLIVNGSDSDALVVSNKMFALEPKAYVNEEISLMNSLTISFIKKIYKLSFDNANKRILIEEFKKSPNQYRMLKPVPTKTDTIFTLYLDGKDIYNPFVLNASIMND